MSKVYIVIYQVYEEIHIFGVFSSKEGADNLLEEIRIQKEKDFPGCWELGGWKEERDWKNGGKLIKVRNGNGFKNFFIVEEHELEK